VAFAWHTPHAALQGPVGIEKANTITYAVRAKGKTRPRSRKTPFAQDQTPFARFLGKDMQHDQSLP